jgi:hypothetical protein
MAYTGLPIVGLDAAGNNVMMVTNSSGSTFMAAGSATTNFSINWSNTSVHTLYKNASGEILALGTGVSPSGVTTPLAWKYSNSQWTVCKTSLHNTNPDAINFESIWLVADGTGVMSSDFNVPAPGPAGGLSDSLAILTVLASGGMDNLNKGSTVVASSRSTIGTWTKSNGWTHNVGPVSYVPTGHLKTTYTFPGYAGANAQVQYAANTRDGYSHGLVGSPQISVTWSA